MLISEIKKNNLLFEIRVVKLMLNWVASWFLFCFCFFRLAGSYIFCEFSIHFYYTLYYWSVRQNTEFLNKAMIHRILFYSREKVKCILCRNSNHIRFVHRTSSRIFPASSKLTINWFIYVEFGFFAEFSVAKLIILLFLFMYVFKSVSVIHSMLCT